jgi:hypothetical protein
MELKARAGGFHHPHSPEVPEAMRRWPAWTKKAVPALVRVLLGEEDAEDEYGNPNKRGRGRPPKKPRLLLHLGNRPVVTSSSSLQRWELGDRVLGPAGQRDPNAHPRLVAEGAAFERGGVAWRGAERLVGWQMDNRRRTR